MYEAQVLREYALKYGAKIRAEVRAHIRLRTRLRYASCALKATLQEEMRNLLPKIGSGAYAYTNVLEKISRGFCGRVVLLPDPCCMRRVYSLVHRPAQNSAVDLLPFLSIHLQAGVCGNIVRSLGMFQVST